MTVVRAAITQTTWTGDKESMLDKHEQFARDAAKDGAQIVCFQELFYGPYFGITEDKKYYRYAEPADGPIVQRFAKLAKELNVVMILPIYEEDITGVYYNTAVIVESDGQVLGKYRKHHIPNLDRFWEKFYFRPGNLGYPVFDTSVGKVGLYICYDRHFPEGWRELGLNGAHMVFNPERDEARALEPAVGGRRTVRCGREWLLRAPAEPRRPRGQRVRRTRRRLLRHQPGHRPARQFRRRARLRRARGDPHPRSRPGYGAADARRLAVLSRPSPGELHEHPEAVEGDHHGQDTH